MNFRRQADDCDKGIEKSISDKGVLWARHNTIFSMTWLGSQVAKKSKVIYDGMKAKEYQGVSGNS